MLPHAVGTHAGSEIPGIFPGSIHDRQKSTWNSSRGVLMFIIRLRELVGLDNLIKGCDDNITDFSSKLAERRSLTKE